MGKVKNIGVLSLAKLQAVLGAHLGLALGILYSFGGLLLDILLSSGLLSPEAMSTSGLSYGTLLAFAALIGMPFMFAIVGYLLGMIEALLYNLFARWFGGFKIDFELNKE